MFVIATIIVPVQTIIVPQFSLYNSLRLTQRLALVVPAFFGMGLKGGIFIFLFRQFFLKISPSLEEAAAIDGCNPYSTYFRIILPTSGPGAAGFLDPFDRVALERCVRAVDLYNGKQEPDAPPAPSRPGADAAGFAGVVHAESLATVSCSALGVIMAVAPLRWLPLVIMYFILQKRFVQSIDRTGLVE